MSMQVRFFDPAKGYRRHKEEIDTTIQDVLGRGDLVLREDVERFEQSLADFVGTKYAVGLNSGTDALFFALLAAGIGPGDEVITVSHTFIATIQTIVQCGATPILVDVGADGLMDMDEVAKAITPRTKAIIPVHLEGNVCDLRALVALKGLHDDQFSIIEDAAQALGGEVVGKAITKKAGSVGIAGCFSFYPAKILGAYGDAGALVTSDEKVYEEVKRLRNHYYIGKYMGIEDQVVRYGYNSRLDNLQAAVLNVKMRYLKDWLDRRKEIANLYTNELNGIPNLLLPTNAQGRVWQDYVIRVLNGERNELKDYLKNAGIETLGADLIPNHTYKGLGLEKYTLPNTERIYAEQIRLPCNENLTDEEVGHVIRTIKEFYG